MRWVTSTWFLLFTTILSVHAEAKKCSKKSGKCDHKESSESNEDDIPRGYVDGRLCNRHCDGRTKSCYFEFDVETFYTMSKACYNCPSNRDDCYRPDCIVAGGIPRTVMVVNRTMPGPAIEVCEGDEVRVLVKNGFADGEDGTIHWHGQHMKGNNYMDGVPFITQCPIHYNNEFTYVFFADDAGTHWWHSHVETQRGDGVFGCLIVRQQHKENKHYDLYDYDLSSHVIMAMDWNDRLRLDVFEAYALGGNFLEPTGILVNGFGYQFNNNVTNTPLANFVVRKNKKYRFRFINVGFFDCPLEFSIDGHTMTIIATDGHDVHPVKVNSFVSSSGERFDFIVHANKKTSTYWIRVKGYLTCERLQTYTVATLQYKGSDLTLPTTSLPTYNDSSPSGGVILNPVSRTNATGYSKVIGIDDLRALIGIPHGFDTDKPRRFYLTIDMNAVNNPTFHRYLYYGFYQVAPYYQARTPQIDDISFKPPPVPLLVYRDSLKERGLRFCNHQTMKHRNCTAEFCECLHGLEVRLGDVVEFVFIELWNQNDSPALHPLHLHGYTFRVLAWHEIGQGLTREQVIKMDKKGKLKRNYIRPPQKDTVTVPKGGYTIIRWIADNPGYWFMHCHIDAHASEGMALVVKVGHNDEMPDAPKHFPTCGNWPPESNEDGH